MSEGQNFNLLPIDVIKLMVDVYYTPIIETLIIDDDNNKYSNKKFYMILTYPSHTIKIHIPRPCISQKSRGGLCYESKNITAFWHKLNNYHTQEGNNQLNEDEIKIKLTSKNICIISEHTTIDLPNTEIIRGQILDVIYYYIEYLDNENIWL